MTEPTDADDFRDRLALLAGDAHLALFELLMADYRRLRGADQRPAGPDDRPPATEDRP